MADRSRAVFEEVARLLVRDLYDRPVMSNLVRPQYVEYLVAIALGPGWRLVGGDWSVSVGACNHPRPCSQSRGVFCSH